MKKVANSIILIIISLVAISCTEEIPSPQSETEDMPTFALDGRHFMQAGAEFRWKVNCHNCEQYQAGDSILLKEGVDYKAVGKPMDSIYFVVRFESIASSQQTSKIDPILYGFVSEVGMVEIAFTQDVEMIEVSDQFIYLPKSDSIKGWWNEEEKQLEVDIWGPKNAKGERFTFTSGEQWGNSMQVTFGDNKTLGHQGAGGYRTAEGVVLSKIYFTAERVVGNAAGEDWAIKYIKETNQRARNAEEAYMYFTIFGNYTNIVKIPIVKNEIY